MHLKELLGLLPICSILCGCATTAIYSNAPLTQYDKNTKYAVEPAQDGFNISISYSRYQFVPESSVIATACKQALTSIAFEYAGKQGREISQINEQTIRLSMGRNGLTGITSCSAAVAAKWKTETALINPPGAQPGVSYSANSYKALATSLAIESSENPKLLAVLGFQYVDGRNSRDGVVVSERLTTEIVKNKSHRVVEREQIEKLLGELKLQQSGAITLDSAKELGHLLGADYVILGTITELKDSVLEINVRLVDVLSGEIIKASNGRVERDWEGLVDNHS